MEKDELVWIANSMIGIVGILILILHYWYWEIYKMKSKIYRCGWCGCPTDKKGNTLRGDKFKKAVNIIKTYGDYRTERTHGDCCARDYI